MKNHIAVFNLPAHGHINPTLAVIKELVSRGYRVTYATTEAFAPIIKAMGAEPILYQSSFPTSPLSRDLLAHGQSQIPLFILNEALVVIPQIEESYRNDKPDLVLYDSMAMFGRFYAEKQSIPAVQLFASHADNDQFSLTKAHGAFDPTHPGMIEFAQKLKSLRTEQGLPETKDIRLFSGNADLNIVFLPRFFQYEGSLFNEKYVFVGPCLGDRSFQGSWTPPENDKPILFISLGTVFNAIWPEFYRICLDAFFDLDWNILMSTGTAIDPKNWA